MLWVRNPRERIPPGPPSVHLYSMWSVCKGGGWYGRDLHNYMICICRFVVTDAIVGIACKKFPQSITSQAGVCFTLWTWGRSGCVTEGEDQEWSVVVAYLKVEIRGGLLSKWSVSSEQLLERLSILGAMSSWVSSEQGAASEYPRGRKSASDCLDMCHDPVWVRFWPLQ